ncbi:MAG: hypothetical protein WBA67_16815 [Jannaschia sp.]
MTEPSLPALGKLGEAVARLDAATRELAAAREAIAAANDMVQGCSKGSLKASSKGLRTSPEPVTSLAEHRRLRRSGVPSKIDTDPELRAFVLARIDTATYQALAEEIAEAFPEDRRVHRSAVCRWWNREQNRREG